MYVYNRIYKKEEYLMLIFSIKCMYDIINDYMIETLIKNKPNKTTKKIIFQKSNVVYHSHLLF